MDKSKALIELKTAEDVARQYFPNELPQILETIIWGCTGYPSSWQDASKTPEQNFRIQLQEAADKGYQNVLNESW